ncbi:hypothetical protein Aeqsu_1543 [Aequorivita sublithincola DSM 14238]|uniref:Uncharacterized protein n=1 Tax=Aequorivita sublithincola (strain DSM 14238 / LMG 21431 / ACAM 643 / 9-3) TaxID=746697 RepID=I3YVL0_AEQSU|nr:hypothetical protein [Aequorivita sublithincola]AFL81028.1 hypothetical protein Aeqsu_1543 [Aequorivita sublithincola DSM 14238]
MNLKEIENPIAEQNFRHQLEIEESKNRQRAIANRIVARIKNQKL